MKPVEIGSESLVLNNAAYGRDYTLLTVGDTSYKLEEVVYYIKGDKVQLKTFEWQGETQKHVCSELAKCAYVISID